MVEKAYRNSLLVTRFLVSIGHSGLEFPWHIDGIRAWALLSSVAGQRNAKPERFTVARYALLNPTDF